MRNYDSLGLVGGGNGTSSLTFAIVTGDGSKPLVGEKV